MGAPQSKTYSATGNPIFRIVQNVDSVFILGYHSAFGNCKFGRLFMKLYVINDLRMLSTAKLWHSLYVTST